MLTIGLAQIAPVWFNREKTLAKVCDRLTEAAASNCKLVAFGEALVPGYPFWLEYSRVTEFNSVFHKEFHAEYMNQAVCIERGDLQIVCDTARDNKIAAYLGRPDKEIELASFFVERRVDKTSDHDWSRRITLADVAWSDDQRRHFRAACGPWMERSGYPLE